MGAALKRHVVFAFLDCLSKLMSSQAENSLLMSLYVVEALLILYIFAMQYISSLSGIS